MRQLTAVVAKEWRDILRDRRTLHLMVVVPLVFYPAIAILLGVVQPGTPADGGLRVMVSPPDEGWELQVSLEQAGHSVVQQADRAQAFLWLPEGFNEALARSQPAQIEFRAVDGAAAAVLRRHLEEFRMRHLRDQLHRLGPAAERLSILEIREERERPPPRLASAVLLRAALYFLIFICFTGALPAAIDLGAGEKERGTLETLLTAPVPLPVLLGGKLLVVSFCGLASAGLSVAGLAPVLLFGGESQRLLAKAAASLLTPGHVALALALLTPLAVFFGALQLTVSFSSRSAREAQHRTTPLMMVMVLLLVWGMLPGTPLSLLTSLVPALNVMLVLREAIGGSLRPDLLLLTLLSLAVFTAAAVAWGARLIGRERTLFRD